MITGGCLCGAVRYRTEAEPVISRLCWCRVCQYFALGNAAVGVCFPTEGLSVTGELRDFESVADSGNRMHRRFCPVCGTFSVARSLGQIWSSFVRARWTIPAS
ncbi:MAG TPA: GFA family protein [Rhizobiaceae bacterium]|nr:GFA family protein [Rhizobiaceae bacterium]